MIMATVKEISASGTKLQFDGEETTSGQFYYRLGTYTPTIDDRVLVEQIAGTHVILGKVIK